MAKNKNLITQDNALINASYTLDLVEKRLILLAIAKGRLSGKGITAHNALEIHANDYAESFGVERQASYMALKSASESLFERYFTYESLSPKGNLEVHKSRWTADISYVQNESMVKIVFSPSVVPLITDLEKKFTSYFLDDISKLTSVYAVRLYELIIAWRSTHKTPIFKIEDIRMQLGVLENQYIAMCDFKKRVLDVAIKQINELSNIQIEVKQHKKGRSIVGFSFDFIELTQHPIRDPKTIDWIDEQPKAKPKRKRITEQEAAKLGRPGEEWPDLLKRIGSEYHVIFDKNSEHQ
ncbi:replication initiation protein RepM [Wohlfahrtiimonas chitiniclastica]|uniref:Replication initiation protein RepM n=1 Tax=Wohlfahrtiimonas chitiniclastica TaxID=400946 RepID=A0AB35C2B9_9GAMM|nr:replication initiation protein RepM [Wohlfahrtiimonas chitiniclastica]MBS7815696.1 replication initiation protein RepM [Wohlfahrtiimonas chitiniclastica]MBS7821577.1 replication initiation protein RepM [Wohlfahrtiimonas chitiniclastica]MBS7825518.1 replication initiation protein RepM [Wohlfahrtiimonas chitiniclastica]MBS7841140.1 replication initiation protein RepM [Wohlfahrtiimonas chitiniclastica]MDC7253077.1 hypothetical protein [Wohlfahrtiimonas chitiniclastica]